MNPLQHFELLRRYDRALSLRESIASACRPGMRVLDAGCGVGLLTHWALESGASKVVAVDVSDLELAKALATENGFSDKVDFVQCDLWDLQLPEYRNGFDLIFGMLYLNDPRRDEGQSALFYSLCQRYLATSGQAIPNRVRYKVRACDWPSQDFVSRRNRIHEHINQLQGRYGLQFGALAKAIDDGCWNAHFPDKDADGRLRSESAKEVSNTLEFAVIDYLSEPTQYPEEFSFRISSPGIVNSVIWTQELLFGKQLLFSNETVSWIRNPSIVKTGDLCIVRFGAEWRRTNVATIVQPDER